jgi:tetratricopeptide (TPR) repeat protein
MGQLDMAISMFRQAIRLKPGFGSEGGLAYVLALREDYEGALAAGELYVANASEPGLQFRGRFAMTFFMHYSCRFQSVIDQVETTVKAGERLDYQWGVAGLRWIESWTRYLMGDYEGSRECQRKSLSTAKAINRLDAWLLMMGEISGGRSDLKVGLVEEAKARFAKIDSLMALVPEQSPENATNAEFIYAMYRAEILLAEGKIDECIEVCRGTPLPAIPDYASASIFFYNYPANRDVLARAYVQNGAPDEAIAEYERLTTLDPDSKDRRLIFPLFHHRLGVLYAQDGQSDKAVVQFEKFLEICGDIDPELPEVTDARRRLAVLNSGQKN